MRCPALRVGVRVLCGCRMNLISMLRVAFLLTMAACSGSASGETVDQEGEDLSSTYEFHCKAAHSSHGADIASIRLTHTRATLTSADPSISGVAAVYTYNPNYQPRSASHQGYTQYAWTDDGSHKMVLLFDRTMRSGGALLAGGGHGGDVTLEGPRISHAITSMVCTR